MTGWKELDKNVVIKLMLTIVFQSSKNYQKILIKILFNCDYTSSPSSTKFKSLVLNRKYHDTAVVSPTDPHNFEVSTEYSSRIIRFIRWGVQKFNLGIRPLLYCHNLALSPNIEPRFEKQIYLFDHR